MPVAASHHFQHFYHKVSSDSSSYPLSLPFFIVSDMMLELWKLFLFFPPPSITVAAGNRNGGPNHSVLARECDSLQSMVSPSTGMVIWV